MINFANNPRIALSGSTNHHGIHGRTKEDKYKGEAEYDTIASVVSQVEIPVIANGDITSAKKAKQILDDTGASGVMVGRAAQG
jgi:tRNA-dihydrouridine synthase B